MSTAQLWTLVAVLTASLVALGVGVVAIVHRGANQIRRGLDARKGAGRGPTLGSRVPPDTHA